MISAPINSAADAPGCAAVPGHIALDGPLNFRDLGGIVSRDGRMIRTGVLYRADDLGPLSAADMVVLAQLGLQTVIDLRTPWELGRSSLAYREAGITHHHVPIIQELWSAEMVSAEDPALDLAMRYVQMVEHGASALAKVVSMAANRQHGPTVFHCAAGKDRTGVAAALIERVLGVDDEVIISRYAASGPVMVGLSQRWARIAESDRDGGGPVHNAPAHFRDAPPAALRSFLQIIDDRFGGVEELLFAAGLVGADLEVLRHRMLA